MITKEINLGVDVCKKLKDIYFADSSWNDCHQKVSQKFTVFKKILRKFYSESNNVELLKRIKLFDTLSFQEVFEMETDLSTDNLSTGVKNKYGNNVTWIAVPVDKPELYEVIRKLLVEDSTDGI